MMSLSIATAQQQRVPTLPPSEVVQRIKDTSVVVLDVRTPAEFAEGYIPGSRLIPVQELPQRLRELESLREKTIIAYCRSGNRSAHAVRILRHNGFNAFNMSGGILEWKHHGYPLTTPKPAVRKP
ncbi:MAG: rhodanese-like domain-containing protein [Bacteroidota bacterium]|nr:rhodanese-like domain-containing protein [Bacteroidota bacterium]